MGLIGFGMKTDLGHININSVRNKFKFLVDLVSANLDVLMISEINVSETFSGSQFIIEEFSEPYWFDSKWWRDSLIRKIKYSYQTHQRDYSRLFVLGSFHRTKLEK